MQPTVQDKSRMSFFYLKVYITKMVDDQAVACSHDVCRIVPIPHQPYNSGGTEMDDEFNPSRVAETAIGVFIGVLAFKILKIIIKGLGE